MRRRRQGRATDSQKRRVYKTDWDLESLRPDLKDWSLPSLQGLLDESWKVRGCEHEAPVLLVNRRLTRTSRFMWKRQFGHLDWTKIELAPNMMSAVVLMHELTHAEMLFDLLDHPDVPVHGPLFASKHRKALGQTLGAKVRRNYNGAAALHGLRIAWEA